MNNIFKILNIDLVPKIPLFLALGGTIPFIFLSLGIWFFSYELKLLALYNLLNYSVIIITFIGAIYWGKAMIDGDKKIKPYIISIIPSLISWFMLMGFITNYVVLLTFLIVAFFLMYFIDIKYMKKGFFPSWYMQIRKIVSFIVITTLCFAIIGVNTYIL